MTASHSPYVLLPRKLRGLISVGLLSLFLGFAGRTPAFSELIVFGDSLSDTGNVFKASFGGIPGAPYFDGRFSNGSLWVEHLANSLGLSAEPHLGGGTNYAYGGANTGPLFDIPPSLVDQSQLYLLDAGLDADPNALFVVFGGGNDVRDRDIGDSVSDLSGIVTTLAGQGATTFVVPNLPDIGAVPASLSETGGGSVETGLTLSFNEQLRTELGLLRSSLGITIFEPDFFGAFNALLDDPESFGFSNIDTPCFDELSGSLCSDPDQYLFWDDLHPTAAGHQVLGEFASTVVPIPPAAWLFASTLLVLGRLRHRRRIDGMYGTHAGI